VGDEGFEPVALTTALACAIEDADIADDELVDIIGAPSFPSGCKVAGDVYALMPGEPAELRLTARLAREEERDGRRGTRAIVVSALPLGGSPAQIADAIKERAHSRRWHDDHPGLEGQTRFPIADVYDATTGASDGTRTRLVVVLRADATYIAVERWLRRMWA
jgi:DNA gyrase/topoisomerase IV subunit A